MYLEKFLLIIFPNRQSHFLDLSLDKPILRHFPTLNVYALHSSIYQDFKSTINQDKLLVFMTSKRPNVDERGRVSNQKPDPQGRKMMENS